MSPNFCSARFPYYRLIVTAAVLGMAGGCGGSSHGTVNASGKVTFDGGPPPAAGQVYFAPVNAPEGKNRPGSGQFDTSGEFTATSWDPGDGLLPGTYKARVQCWKVEPTADGNPGVSYVATDAPQIEIVIPESGKDDIAIDVPAAK